MVQTAQFLVTGIDRAGKSTFVQSVMGNSDSLLINDELTITCYEAAWDAWEGPLQECVGTVLMFDSTDPLPFSDAQAMIDEIWAVKRVSLIVAMNKQDAEGAHPPKALRDHLPEDTVTKVFPCVATDAQSAQNVLLALIYQMLSSGKGQ